LGEIGVTEDEKWRNNVLVGFNSFIELVEDKDDCMQLLPLWKRGGGGSYEISSVILSRMLQK
jgi:hypothetical protein